ncbi:pentatricopeptide repeat-containing protein 2, mitochondrial isoform X3 [Calypte anna]|uniref:pentatricopeptide repeat-containing protein 2, mitochondrial isoform X3 n=1 Tax=Calypte anna TaxID=9244 RepID=UPI0011C4A196|nr:pentatricopeptide repeat-containing protein 2, mitochondrial isoform X3 [Calypte anna]
MAPREEGIGSAAGQAYERPAQPSPAQPLAAARQAPAEDGGGARWRLPAGGAGGVAALGGSFPRLGLLGLRSWRYHEQNGITNVDNFKFGPLFMRMCYELDLESPAVELIKDQNLRGFFSESTSFHILMTMLFKKSNFESALEVLVEMKNQGVPFSKETYLLAFAICYKLGSLESCKISLKLLEEAQLKGVTLPLRVFYFAVATALKQNDVALAKFYCSQIMQTESKLYNNLKVLVQLRSGLLEEVIKTLEEAVEVDTPPFVKKIEFSEQVLATVREKMEENPNLSAKLGNIYTKLQASGRLTSSTLEDMLFQVPTSKKTPAKFFIQKQLGYQAAKSLRSNLLLE